MKSPKIKSLLNFTIILIALSTFSTGTGLYAQQKDSKVTKPHSLKNSKVANTRFLEKSPGEFRFNSEAETNLNQNTSWQKESFGSFDPDKEIISLRTLNTKHFINEDGSQTAFISESPIHYFDDNELKTIYHAINYSGNEFVNLNNEIKSYYPTILGNGVKTILKDGSVYQDMLDFKIYYELDESLVLLKDGQSTQGSLNGNKLFYSNAYGEGTSVNITQNSTGHKLDYIFYNDEILQSVPTESDKVILEERMILPNGVDAEIIDNVVYFFKYEDGNKIYLGKIRKPEVWDSSSTINSAGLKDSRITCSYSIEQIGINLWIRLNIPSSWLLSDNRVFPITIDPTLDFATTNANYWTGSIRSRGNSYGLWSSGDAYQDFTPVPYIGANPTNYGGWQYDYSTFHSYFKFNISSITDGSTINSVDLSMHYNTGYASNIYGYGASYINYELFDLVTDPGPNSANLTARLSDIRGGTLIGDGQLLGTDESKWLIHSLANNAESLVSSALLNDWWGVGVKSTGTYYVDDYCALSGSNQVEKPFLTINYTPPAVISISGSLSAFSTCSGSASPSENFNVSGTDLQSAITITAPTGFEVSADNSSFSSSVIIGSSGNVSSTTVYVRVTNSASGNPSGNVVCSSTNATSQNVAASGTVNPVPSSLSATSDGANSADICSGGTVALSGSASISPSTESQTVLNDGFTNLTNWTETHVSGAESWSASAPGGDCTFTAYSGSSCAWIQESNTTNSEDYIVYDISAPYTGMSLSYYYINPNWSGDIDWLYVQYFDGSTWTNLAFYQTAHESWTSATHAVPDGATKIRFYSWLGYGFGIGVDDVTLTKDVEVTPTLTYSWSEDGGSTTFTTGSSATSNTLTANSTITMTVSDPITSCSATATTSVNVDPQLSISSHPSDGSDVCIGETPTAMSVTATGGSGSYSYQWYSNTSNSSSGGTIIPVATSSSYTPGAGSAGLNYYYCVVSDAQSGCNDATSNAAQQRVNSVTPGTIESSIDGGTTYGSAINTRQVGNDIFWDYTGSDFHSFEYSWDNGVTAWNTDFITTDPGSWGNGQTAGADGTLSIRAKAQCGTSVDYTNTVQTDWVYNYGGNGNAPTSAITASLSGTPSSLSNGGDMRIDQTVTFVKPSTSFESTSYAFQYEWNNDGNWSGDWFTGQNAVWSDNIGSNVSSGDAVLTVRTRHYGSGNDSYSAEYAVTLKKPVISTSGSLSAFSNCSGGASSAQSFNVSGSYLGSDVTITAPTGFELSESSGGTYTSSITLSPTNGTLASMAVFIRVTSSASGTPSGNVVCTATAATTVNVAASATVGSAPVITSASSFTGTTTCGVMSIDISVDTDGATGTWADGSNGLFVIGESETTNTYATNTYNTPLTLTWTNSSGAVCANASATITARFNQPNPTGSMDTDSWVWGGLTNSTWSTGSNWYKWDGSKWLKQGASYPDAGSKIYVLSTSDVCVSSTLNNAATSIADLNIQGGTFDLGSTNTSITGNITNDGTMQGGTGTVTLSGSADQTISGTGTINFNNLTVNKSSGSAIISTQTDIRNTLTMTKGNIVNSQPVVIGVNSSNPGTLSHASGTVTGELRRYFANATGSTFFPVGTSSNMRDVTINFTQPPGTDEYLTVSYLSGAPTLGGSEGAYSGLPLVTGDNQLIQNYSADGHWNIDPTGGLYESTEINNANYEMTLHCKALSIQPTDISKVRIIKSAGSENSSLNHVTWTGLDLLSASGSPDDFTITAAAQGFSKFGAGSDNGNALPVELVSFGGSCNDGVVDVTWTTASEYNSSHFELENSRDGITWDVVKTIEAAGFSNELITYGYKDFHSNSGDNYYRLTQVDLDGTSKTYDVINVSCFQTVAGYFSIFPNPSSGSFQVILNNSDILGSAELNIVDTKGNKVMLKSIDVKSGINMFAINENLAPGIYYISVLNGNYSTIVLKHSVK